MLKKIRAYSIIFTIASIIGGGILWGLFAMFLFYLIPTK